MYAKQEDAIDVLHFLRDMPGVASDHTVSRATLAARAEAMATTLRAWGADEKLQTAGVLAVSLAGGLSDEGVRAIATAYGEGTAELVTEAVHFLASSPVPLSGAHWQDDPSKGTLSALGKRGEPLVLQRIHAFCAAYRDADLAFIYAALLWRRFQQAQQADDAARRAYGDEARLLLAPFLEMLGMRELRSLVDRWLLHQTRGAGPEQTEQEASRFASLTDPLRDALPGAEFVVGRYTQTHNSITGNLADGTFHTQPTLVIDVLVDDPAACYTALYEINRRYLPVDGGLIDNLQVGRVNGYRCLSTTVIALIDTQLAAAEGETHYSGSRVGGKKVRAQFRIATRELDEINRWGLAAYRLHGRTEERHSSGWWNDAVAGRAKIAQGAPGSLPETLFVFSPHGQLFEFHRNCTVVDYAYYVHSDLADQCLQFKVNGQRVEPSTVLRHLDLVELEYDAHAPGPTQVWLNAARTSRARAKIKRFLKRRDQDVFQGEHIVREQLSHLADHYRFSIPEYRVQQEIRRMLSRMQLSTLEDYYSEIAGGRVDARSTLNRLFANELIGQIAPPSGLRPQPKLHLAQCCRPRPNDEIVGRAKRRSGAIFHIKVHRTDCPHIADLAERPEDRIALAWKQRPKLKLLAQLEMIARNEDGLLGEALAQIYAVAPRATLHRSEAVARRGVAHINFIIESESQEVIDQLAAALSSLPRRTVTRVRVLDVSRSGREDLASVGSSSINNPYSRMPVNEREMFFGRRRELERISDGLHGNIGPIWLRGQKRVGKTSLLLHLKNVYLEPQAFVPVYVDFQLLHGMDDVSIFYEVATAVHSDLQTSLYRADSHIDELGPPIRELFAHEPSRQLLSYLGDIQSRLSQGRIVLLLDEFSRTIDARDKGRLHDDFFKQWRGLILNSPGVSFVTVIQQKTFDKLEKESQETERIGMPDQEAIWELLELGEQIMLRPLNADDVRRLIEWPIRDVLEYPPELVEYVATLTGGSPFLIQAFCAKLVTDMNRSHSVRITPAEVEATRLYFMQPSESIFAHLLDLIPGIGQFVAQALADISGEKPAVGASYAQLCEALPLVEPDQVGNALRELTAQDIFVEIENGRWRFASLLFQQWLQANPIA